MAVRFHLDEHVDGAIALALRRRSIDVTTTIEAGLQSATDLQHLEFAREQRRVIHTNDPDFLAHAASSVEHAGIAFCHSGNRTLGQIIEGLLLIVHGRGGYG